MIDDRKIPEQSNQPLPASDLAKDAQDAGIQSDEKVEGGSDTHLPASEADELRKDNPGRSQQPKTIAPPPD